MHVTVRMADWERDGDALRAVRTDVFTREQQIPADIEYDGLDPHCVHVLAITGSGNPVGTARMQADGHIGRMAVCRAFRRRGVGTALLQALFAHARGKGLTGVYLNAQRHAVPFYESVGFVKEGESFLEADIEHYRMTKRL